MKIILRIWLSFAFTTHDHCHSHPVYKCHRSVQMCLFVTFATTLRHLDDSKEFHYSLNKLDPRSSLLILNVFTTELTKDTMKLTLSLILTIARTKLPDKSFKELPNLSFDRLSIWCSSTQIEDSDRIPDIVTQNQIYVYWDNGKLSLTSSG